MDPAVLLLYLITYGSKLSTPLVVEQSVYATWRRELNLKTSHIFAAADR